MKRVRKQVGEKDKGKVEPAAVDARAGAKLTRTKGVRRGKPATCMAARRWG
jgi:hypothetical protein